MLTRFLSLDKGGRLYLRAGMSHAMRGGLRSQNTEDRFASLFRGLECICKAQGMAAQNLADQLDSENRELAEHTLHGAARDLRSAAMKTRGGGDVRQAQVLETIAVRVRNANNMDKNFGSQLRELLDRLQLRDVEAMEANPRRGPVIGCRWSTATGTQWCIMATSTSTATITKRKR